MPLIAFFDGLDNITSAGRFFVDLTARLGDGELEAGENATRLARTLGVTIPSELAGASIVSLGNGKVAELGTGPSAERARPRIVIHYPPVPDPCPGQPGQVERKFKKCWTVCKGVGPATVCATVCVDITIGLSGIGGKITATVSVDF